MIGYVTLGTNDLKKAAVFYDKMCAEVGAGRFMENDRIIAWGKPGGGAGIGLALPFDGPGLRGRAGPKRAQADRNSA